MAAAALAAGPVVDLADKTAAAVKEQVQELADDPMQYFGLKARKVGYVTLFAGIGALILGYAAKRIDQSILNDITNTIGLNPQTPPTVGTAAAPAPPAPPPAVPPQIVALNQVINDINALGTASAAANVALLQDALNQLWALATYIYGGGTAQVATQYPSQALGSQLAIAIMQTCTLIYEFEGREVPTIEPWWTWQWYVNTGAGVYATDPPKPWSFLQEMTQISQQPYSAVGIPDWGGVAGMLSSTVNNDNYKITLNQLAQELNATTPFDVTAAPSGNFWGPLGTIAADLGGVGAILQQFAQEAVSDVEAFGKDVAQFAGDIGQALGFIGKVLLNLPRLAADGLGYGVWWAIDMVCNAVWSFLVIVGIACIAFSIFALNVYPKIRNRLAIYAKARGARLYNWLDVKLGTREKVGEVWTQMQTEAAIEAASVEPVYTRSTTVLPSVKVPLEGTRIRTRILKPGEKEAPEGPAGDTVPGMTTEETKAPEIPPPPIVGEVPPKKEPPEAPGGVPTPENAPEGPSRRPTEPAPPSDESEEGPSEAELAEMERNRVASLPAAEKPDLIVETEPPLPAETYRRRSGMEQMHEADAAFEAAQKIPRTHLPPGVSRLRPEEARAVAVVATTPDRKARFERIAEEEEGRQERALPPHKNPSMTRTVVMGQGE